MLMFKNCNNDQTPWKKANVYLESVAIISMAVGVGNSGRISKYERQWEMKINGKSRQGQYLTCLEFMM